ncbi:MAG: hypothetical protein ACKVOQ_02190 [Cyclobacteriaceae bacterium]
MKKMFYAGIFVLFVVFGLTAYRQSENAKIYRTDKNRMHRELVKVRYEAQAAKLEIAKLRQVIEAERKNAQELMRKALKK